jgi:predicted O-linked N-acetylglucosamine transferase (SPINDLY family)
MDSHLSSLIQQVIQNFQDGDFDAADSLLKNILDSDTTSADIIFKLAIAYANANRINEARVIFSLLYSYNNKDVKILYNLGLINSLQGNHMLALEAYDLALKIKPDDIETLINKSSVYIDIKSFTLALETIDRAIQIDPRIPDAWLNKGIALNNLSLYEDSINAYDEVLNINSDYVEAWSNKGISLHELKRYNEALNCYDNAITLKPDYAEAFSNKANTLNELKRYNEALNCYDSAITLKPDYAEAFSNKANTLNELKRYNEALNYYDKAITLKPDYAEAWLNKGIVLHELKYYDEALRYCDKALRLNRYLNWIDGYLIHIKMKMCAWSGLDDDLIGLCNKVMKNEKVISPFPLLSMIDDPLIHFNASGIYAKDKYPFNISLGPIAKSSKKEKIHIAYFSPDFQNHPISYLTSELFEIHNRDRFEVFAFSLQKTPIGDEMNLRLRKSFDKFIDVENMADLEIAKLARQLEVDIAIDLAGPTQFSRTGIFSYRAAPIQVNWLGYPGTIGSNFIDYIVADKTIIPESHQQFYAEKLVYLPDTYMVDDSKRVASSRSFTRVYPFPYRLCDRHLFVFRKLLLS